MDHTEHVRLMLDMMVLAFRTDSTRDLAPSCSATRCSGKNFSFLEGVKGGHHEISHHENDPKKLDQYQRINQLARRAVRLHARQDGADPGGRRHPAGQLDGPVRARHARRQQPQPAQPADRPGRPRPAARSARAAPRRTARTRRCATSIRLMLDRVGAPVERFGDSTGRLKGLADKSFSGTSEG